MFSSSVFRLGQNLLFRCSTLLVAGVLMSGAVGCGAGNFANTTSSGGGTAPTPGATLTFSPTSLTFASTMSGLQGSSQTVTVTSTGTASVTISNIAATAEFTAQNLGCNVALTTGSSCGVLVTFYPSASGARTGTLSVTSNAAGSPQSVALSGTATPSVPLLSISTTAVAFGTVTTGMSSAPYSITATNLGSAALSLSNISVTGDYTQTSPGCAASLPSRASCQIFVTFKPTVAGVRAGTLSIGTNAAAGTQSVSLTGTGATAVTYAGSAMHFAVKAGLSKAIVGAAVQLYAAGSNGNGSAPSALLPLALVTDATGSVSVPAGYVCPASNSPLYVVSRGGTVAGASSPNANIALMTAIGSCNAVASGAGIVIDEATTVAAAEALQQFYALGGAIGATASNVAGLTTAFATAGTLADPLAGTSPGSTLPSTAVSPALRVNSLANLLNACVSSSAACASLYASTAPATTQPTNTLDAAWYLAHNPAHNVAALYTQSQTSTAYTPALASLPTDWTLFVTYSGGGMNSPSGIAVDSTGSVWVSSYFGAASKFTPLGAPVFANGITGSGLNNSYGLGIDLSDNVWIPNEQPFTSVGIGSVSEFTSAGVSLAGNGYLNGGMNYPLSVAIDPNGTVWVVDYGNSHLTLLNPSGTPLSGTTGYTTPLFAFPVAVAVDANHYGWIVNQSSNQLTRVAPDGSTFTNYTCCTLASGIALDQGDNIWVANYFGDTISLVTNAGTVVSGSYTGGGSIYHPQGMAVDGAGTLWVANYREPYLTVLSGAASATPGAPLSPAGGLGGDAGLLEAYALALDAGGNVWASNQGSNTVTKFIGLAVPVKTPLSALPQLP